MNNIHAIGDLLLSRSLVDRCLGQITNIYPGEGGYTVSYSIYWFTGCRDKSSAGYTSGEISQFKESLRVYKEYRRVGYEE